MGKYDKEIADFRSQVIRQYKVNDCRRPVKGTKRLEINVVEDAPGEKGSVFLYYTEEFRRIFGRNNHAFTHIYDGELKTACEIARELKEQLGENFKIVFQKYTEMELF